MKRSIIMRGILRRSPYQLERRADIHTIVMIRHGESIWNMKNNQRFTGWCDIPLTENGEGDARDAGRLLRERGMKFDVAFTSNLERAWRTCAIILSEAHQADIDTVKSWRLNERHYGGLQGHLKNSTSLANAFSEETIIEWRRSFLTAPPSLRNKDFRNSFGLENIESTLSAMDPSYLDHTMRDYVRKQGYFSPRGEQSYPTLYPHTESLVDCQERAFGYWKSEIAPQVRAGRRVLVVAHANTIRALVKSFDDISDDMIAHLKIPNGIPLIYQLDENLEPVDVMADDIGCQANYLVSARNHGKIMAYERCVRKKLRSLFEYLDTDKDGRITPHCLQTGLIRLQSYNEKNENSIASVAPIICEYEVEELLRCVPSADEKGGVTLEAFLQSEETLLPKLSRLKLLE